MDIAVSTWALHRTVGVSYPDSPALGRQPREQHGAEPCSLPSIVEGLAGVGIKRMELCHFHLDGEDALQVQEVRSAIESNGMLLQNLLIDEGDITDPANGDRDTAWIGKWIEVAAALGAERVRIIAGKQPWGEESFSRAAERIGHLIGIADEFGIRVVTENWFSLTSTPEAVNSLLDGLSPKLGLCADFGNWRKPGKYHDLPLIMGRAETCHAKCDFLNEDEIDMDDFGQCLEIARGSGYQGPFTLVNGGPNDEWKAVKLSSEAILGFFKG